MGAKVVCPNKCVMCACVRAWWLGAGFGGADHPGVFSSAGAAVVAGTPSVHPNYPCGQVHTNIWYFAAPPAFLGNMELAYDGRLMFERLAPSHSGVARNARGSVVVRGAIVASRVPCRPLTNGRHCCCVVPVNVLCACLSCRLVCVHLSGAD